MKSLKRYIYDGPVIVDRKLASYRWCSEVTAISETKAKHILKYLFKKGHPNSRGAKIDLPGKITLKEERMIKR